jgi:hypothetical protein
LQNGKKFLTNAGAAFDKVAQKTDPEEVQKLYEQIGRMKIEIDFLKKNL